MNMINRQRILDIFKTALLGCSITLGIVSCGGSSDPGSGGGGSNWPVVQFGTVADDSGKALTIDGMGNIYVTGQTYSDEFGLYVANRNIFVVKYNNLGVQQWGQLLGTTAEDYPTAIALDDLNNVYITGYTLGDLDGNTSAGGVDMFVSKFDTAGTQLWTRQLGSLDTDYGTGVAVDTWNDVYVAGITRGDLDGNTSAGSLDIFLTKYNSAGTKQWTQQMGTAGIDVASAITRDAASDLILTGYSDGEFVVGQMAGTTDTDVIVIKIRGLTGAEMWRGQYGTTSDDFGNAIATNSAGEVFIAGDTQGDLDGNTSAGLRDIIYTYYTSTGLYQWSKQLGTSGDDVARAIASDGMGGLYLTGETNGNLDGEFNANPGIYDLFVSKYDDLGNKLWTRLEGTGLNEYGRGIGVDTNNSSTVYVTGDTQGGLAGSGTNIGGTDAIIVRYDMDGNQ